jgi:predicted permease
MTNLRYAFRQLLKSPGFAFVAIATLALGIGASTAMFSIVNAVLLKPLPFRDPARLVWIENAGTNGLSERTSRADNLLDWRAQSHSFEALGGYFAFFDYGRMTLTGEGEPERLRGVGITDNLLDVLGVSLLHGRNFTADECTGKGPNAVILSYAFWQRRFAGDPEIVGRTVTLNKQPTIVVGVLPRTFDFDAIFSPGSEIELITPFPLTPETASYGNTLFGIGRLRAGVTVKQAQAELDVMNAALRKAHPERWGFGARVSSIDGALRGKFRSSFSILAGAVLCVLAIACVNLSNLLLARINVRRQEFAVRIALGARRRHLVQQALMESLLLAFAGSVVGVPLAVWATDLLARLQTFGVPLLQDAAVDPTALIVTIGLTTIAGIACGLLPALYLSNAQSSGLQNSTHQRTAGRSTSLARSTLVVAEVALACTLLVGSGLLFRSFTALLQVNLGFQPDHAMSWRIDPQRGFKSGGEVDTYLSGLAQRIHALPGVESVGCSDTLPLSRNRSWGAGAVGVEYPKDQYPLAFPRLVDAHYLQAMKIPLISGRYFEERFDPNAPKAVIINENLAHALWPDRRNPLGQKIRVNGESVVIGVVGNVRHSSLEQTGGNEMYLDCRQCGDWSALEMVVRSSRPAASLAPEIRAAIAAYDPAIPNREFYELDRLVDDAVAPRRLITRLLGFFSTLALTLAALGLYGVIAFSVVQRTQEIGIRVAIGAQRRDILRLVLRSGLRLVVIGLALGLVAAFVLTRVLGSLLYGVTAHDPLAFVGNAALLFVVATVACLLPALRATRVDPMVALRAE